MKLNSDLSPSVPFERARRTTPAEGVSLNMAPFGMVLALSTGLAVFIGGGLICWGLGWPVATALIGAGAAIITVALLFTFGPMLPRLLYVTEEIVGLDLDRDGVVGEPIAITVQNNRSLQTLHLPPGTEQKFFTFAKSVTGENRQTIAARQWNSYFGKDYNGQDIYAQVLDRMHQLEWVVWNNPNAPTAGRRLTPLGHVNLEAIAAGEVGERELLGEG